jgi:hypothetical protein
MGQQVLAVVGGVVGGVIGTYTPLGTVYGAELGFAIGGGIGAVAFPPKALIGPRSHLQTQISQYGAAIPLVVGNTRVAAVLIDEDPIGIHEVGSNQGGKGSSPSVTTFSYFGWFAVSLCEGPITDIRRIWANGILIYDVSSTATAATLLASNVFRSQYLTVYKGDATQTPDPTMQGWHGAANTPAYRGTAYIVFRGLPLANYANVLPSISVEVVTTATSLAITKAWENASTGFGFGAFANMPFLTGFSGGTCRAVKKTLTTYNSITGTFVVSLTDGSLLNNDTPTNFENSLSSGSLFLDPAGHNMGMIMIHSSGQSGVYSHALGQIVGHASNTSNASLYVCDTGSFVILGDVLPALTVPPITGAWMLAGAFPAADWKHLAVITHDLGTGNYWLHVIGINSNGPGAEVAYYLFTNPSDGAAAVYPSPGDVGAWVDPYFDVASDTMMESSLNSFWHIDGSSGGQTARYFNLANGQVVQAANLAYSALVGVGWASVYADGGVLVYMADNYAHALTVGQTGTPLSTVPLSTIVSTIAQQCGLQAGQIDVTALTDGVWGFQIDRQMTARAALEAIAPAWWFDAVESDGKLKFVHRSATPVATITLDDMVVTPGQGSQNPLQFVRGSEIELPSQINVGYYSVGADYQVGTQYWRRLVGLESNNVQTVDTAAVMDDTQAAVAAAIIGWDAVAGRVTFKFATSYKLSTGSIPAAQLEPTDIIYIQTTNELYTARITRKTEGAGKIDWEAVACAPVYSQSPAGGAITAGQAVGGLNPTTAIIIDIPPLRDQDGAGDNLYVAMYSGAGWPGGVLFKSSDGGVTWVAGISMGTMSIAGRATTALGNWLGNNMFDEGCTVTVTVQSGQTLSSATELTVLNGGNVAYLGGEILQFKNATLITTNTYKLSGLLRARFGTEAFTAGHVIGEAFVLLSAPGVISIQATPTSDIGQARIYDAVTVNQAIPTGLQQTVTEKGNTLVCWSPVLLNAGGPGWYGDIILRWTRRNRITWQWLENVEEPMSEATEQYIVSIFSGATVVRTFTVNAAQTVTYTLAQQITDFGGSGLQTVTFGVQQVSAVTGPGNMAKATIALARTPVTTPMTLTATQGSSATLLKPRTVAKTLTASQGSSPILVKQPAKIITASQASAVVFSKTTLLSATFDPAKTQSGQTLSNGNLTISATTAPSAANRGTQSTRGRSSGKYYVEFTANNATAGSLNNILFLGLCDSACNGSLANSQNLTYGNWDTGYELANNSVVGSGFGGYQAGDVIAIAVDMSSSPTVTKYYKNNSLVFTHTATGWVAPFFVFAAAYSATSTLAKATVNFGATAFTYTPPAGFSGGW